MSLRSLILALASGAVFAAAVLAPVSASAKPMGIIIKPPGSGKPIGGLKPKPGQIQNIGGVLSQHPTLGFIIHPTTGPHLGGWWWWHHHDHDHPWFWHDHDHPWFVEHGYPMSAPVTTTASAPAADAPCTCLTKTYLNDGSVLFKDVCTKEAAVATPGQMRAQQ